MVAPHRAGVVPHRAGVALHRAGVAPHRAGVAPHRARVAIYYYNQEPMSAAKERQTSSRNYFQTVALKLPYMDLKPLYVLEPVNPNFAVTRYVT